MAETDRPRTHRYGHAPLVGGQRSAEPCILGRDKRPVPPVSRDPRFRRKVDIIPENREFVGRRRGEFSLTNRGWPLEGRTNSPLDDFGDPANLLVADRILRVDLDRVVSFVRSLLVFAW